MPKQPPTGVDNVLVIKAKRAAIHLRSNPEFQTVLQYVEARLNMHQQQLVMVSPDQVPTAQGRARELMDLFDVLKPKDSP